MPELEFTGERLVPGQVDADLLNEHMARYRFAARLARGASGCWMWRAGLGTSAELARWAESVVGLDVSEEAVESARAAYAAGEICVRAGAERRGSKRGHSIWWWRLG